MGFTVRLIPRIYERNTKNSENILKRHHITYITLHPQSIPTIKF